MSYHFSKEIDAGFDEAVERVTRALADNGFGVLTEIDVAATLRKKLGEDMPPYRILGACNPSYAHQALQLEPHIGTMLPCNVIVRQTGEGKVEVSAVDPAASMQAIDNTGLGDVASKVRSILKKMIEEL